MKEDESLVMSMDFDPQISNLENELEKVNDDEDSYMDTDDDWFAFFEIQIYFLFLINKLRKIIARN